MASNTKNVKLGVCSVFYKGTDLGYTSGGVEVTVKTETHKTMVDQFGKTPVNEFIMGREVGASVPLAETTLENMVATMPGSTLTSAGGSVATGALTIATNPIANETIIVNGATVTFKTALAGSGNEVLIGASAALTAANLAAFLNASPVGALASAQYSAAAAVVTVLYGNLTIYGATGNKSALGNAFTLATGTAAAKVTVSGAVLTGGVDGTGGSVSVGTGIGTSLLDIAGELRLHPVNKAIGDLSEDFVIVLAATSGALKFAYKVDAERVFNIEFNGYPNAAGKLFTIGV